MTLDADTARCTIGFSGNNLPNTAAVVIAVDNPGMARPLADVATTVALAATNLQTLMSPGSSITSILVKQGPDETGPSGLFAFNIAGTGTANAVPCNVAVLISKVTNQGGRSGRGRMYWPGYPESKVGGDGIIATADLTALQNEANDFLAKLSADGNQLVLEHGPDSPFGLPGVVLSVPVQARVATQRRRLRR